MHILLIPLGHGVLTSRPIRSGVKYVEVTANAAWHGTRLALVLADGVRTKLIGTVNCKENNDADVYDSEAEYGRWEDEDESNDEDESDDDQGSR